MSISPRPAKPVRKTAILVGEESNLHLIIKNLVKAHDWSIDMPVCNAETAINFLHEFNASGLIILDSSTMPAVESIRILRRDLRAIVTPTMFVLGDVSNIERDQYCRIYMTQAISKPITTSAFSPLFKKMIHSWDPPALRALQHCVLTLADKNSDTTVAVLKKLILAPETSTFAASILARMHVDKGEYAQAESLLISLLKSNPKSSAVLANCAWFYMDAKMPQQALLFLKKLKSVTPGSTVINLDIVGASLAATNYDDALSAMLEWNKSNPGNDGTTNFLARLVLANGRQNDISSIGISPVLVRRVFDQWQLASGSTVAPPLIPLLAVNNAKRLPTKSKSPSLRKSAS